MVRSESSQCCSINSCLFNSKFILISEYVSSPFHLFSLAFVSTDYSLFLYRLYVFKHQLMKSIITILLSTFLFLPSIAQKDTTYANHINFDYTYMIYNAHNGISYRSGADPAVVRFRGEYYMFVTRSMGYWHSTDLNNWNFIKPEKWYFEGSNAPAAHNYKDSVLYMLGNPSGASSVLYTDNQKRGDWKQLLLY